MFNLRHRTTLAAIAFISLVAIGASSAAASGFGPRFGVTIDPDQVHAGLQFHAARITPHWSFVPGFDVGVGDDAIGVSGNFDFKYVFGQGPARWRPFLGGGPGIFFLDEDGDDSETDAGVNFLGGMQTPTRSGLFFAEMRLGLIQEPDVKFTVGWMFR
jgi:hypothetical protein